MGSADPGFLFFAWTFPAVVVPPRFPLFSTIATCTHFVGDAFTVLQCSFFSSPWLFPGWENLRTEALNSMVHTRIMIGRHRALPICGNKYGVTMQEALQHGKLFSLKCSASVASIIMDKCWNTNTPYGYLAA